MPLKILLFLVLSCGIATLIHAQETVVQGKLVDSAGHPLSGATMTLIKLSTGAGVAFSKTDSIGYFKFKITDKIKGEALAVKATFTGYVKVQESINSYADLLVLTMKPEVRHLEEVKVTSKVYIIQKSDTLSFNADLFRDSSDRVLGDLIRKIPGIDIDDNGTIKYNGKVLNNFYIEGDDLLDGKYNIATNNIPSKDVDKVEVIEHNQHIKMLNGIVQSDQPALNIRLKDRSKLKWINNADLGGGTPSKYTGKVNTMAFKPRFKAINNISANNIGNDLSNELTDHLSNTDLTEGFIGIATSRPAGIKQNRYLFNKNQMLNVNDMVKFRSGNTLRLNAYLLHDEQPFSNNSNTTYYLPTGDTVSYYENTISGMRTNHAQATLTLNTNTEKKYFNESFLVDIVGNRNNVEVNTNNTNVYQGLQTILNSFANNLNGVLSIGKSNNIVTYNSSIGYTRNPQVFRVKPGWLPDILNDSMAYLQSSQSTNLPSLTTDNNISFMIRKGYWQFNNKIGVNYDYKKLNSDIAIEQKNDNWLNPSSFQNNLIWKKLDAYYTPAIQFEKDRSRINIYAPIHYYNIQYHDNDNQVKDKLASIYLTPSISYFLKVAKEHEFSMGYQYGNAFSDMPQVYAAGIMQSYRSIQSYRETPLNSGYQNTYNIRFAYKKSLKMFFWNITSSYVQFHRYFMYGSNVTNTSYQIETLPIDNEMKTFNVSGDVSKYIFSLKTTVSGSAGLSRTKSPQLQNGFLFDVNNWSNSYSVGLSPMPVDWLRIDLKANYILGTSSSNSIGFQDQKTSQFKQTSALNFTLLKQITAQFSSEYYASYLNGQKIANCFFLDSYINYRLYKPEIDFRLSCMNLANERNFTVLSASSNIISTRNYQLQPRMFLLSAYFKL
ncbi:MAG: hypothetical protein DI598_01200 [Pseudopedobacter saltans]|uniref:TonB-dependent receptor n=1 Tax=Pseudopedobacter saltans TaxID=151895 RepID=A0A2W5FD25_9SPHI|nr:MAG: hypothetical protein DI598_01200 [Pseudopedobacter saltans]